VVGWLVSLVGLDWIRPPQPPITNLLNPPPKPPTHPPTPARTHARTHSLGLAAREHARVDEVRVDQEHVDPVALQLAQLRADALVEGDGGCGGWGWVR
jgi:hypothetical protein